MVAKLKAPFPWFGGKSRVAQLVWERLGDVDNYIEPFFGSGASLLLRPHPPRIETVNDLDCYVANFWRATQQDPDAVADHADGPVNEADLHSRHRWLVLSDDAVAFRERMRRDPDYFDAKVAGWWCWGLCCWIGSGWCNAENGEGNYLTNRTPGGTGDNAIAISHPGKGIASKGRKPRIDGGEAQYGHGVHAKGENSAEWKQTVRAADRKAPGCGVNGVMPIQQPTLEQCRTGGKGVNGVGPSDTNRPQLADAFSRGRGVNGNDAAGTCAQRRAWILDWFGRLRDRLRTVRVCCGDWLRVCDSESVTTRLGTTGIFFDPPYGAAAGRDAKIYSTDSLSVAGDVLAYCLERGSDRRMRICLAGYAGEGHEVLEENGWTVEAWEAAGGYGNRSEKGKANAKKERLWFSPHCVPPEQPSLFA